MQISIHRLAEPELSEAAEYYSQSRKSLGKEFLDEFDAAVLKIVENPLRVQKYPAIDGAS